MTAKPYAVLKIDEMTRLSDIGGIERFYRIQIKTKGGVVRTADVSEKEFAPQKVAPILAAIAADADSIMAL